MLDRIFVTVINMSITASIAAIMVILLRQLAGKKLPGALSYAAWAIVLIRLLVPFSIQSDLSLFNIIESPVAVTERTMKPSEIRDESIPQDNTGIFKEPGPGASENTYIKDTEAKGDLQAKAFTDEAGLPGKTDPVYVMACIWIFVFLVLLFFCIYTYLKISGSFRTAVLFSDSGLLAKSANKLNLKRKVNIYVSDRTDTPVVTGIANVRIIIPAFLADDYYSKELEYVITHELVHIKRYDNITKLLAVLSLCIHWFNPLIWLCFVLYQKDMEMACDARVLAAYESDVRSEYANSLLNIAVKQNTLLYGPVLAFGESNLKGRIKGIMKFNKNKVWPGVFAALLLVIFAFVLLTNGKNDNIIKTRSSVPDHKIVDRLLQHRSRYIGDASNVGNLLNKLAYGSNKEGIELDTDSEPYGITVNYRIDDIDSSNEDSDELKHAKFVLRDNALILFSLIENVDTVKFNILPSNAVVQFERTQLQQYFDRDLWEYSASKEDFEKFLLDIHFEIFIYPEKYSPAVSSVPGMQILTALNTKYYDIAQSIISYETENGFLLTRNVNTGRITDHGKSLNFKLESAEPVYWSPGDMDENVKENIVTISVLNKNGDVIASKRIRIEKEDDHSFTVKPSYDISYYDAIGGEIPLYQKQ